MYINFPRARAGLFSIIRATGEADQVMRQNFLRQVPAAFFPLHTYFVSRSSFILKIATRNIG